MATITSAQVSFDTRNEMLSKAAMLKALPVLDGIGVVLGDATPMAEEISGGQGLIRGRAYARCCRCISVTR